MPLQRYGRKQGCRNKFPGGTHSRGKMHNMIQTDGKEEVVLVNVYGKTFKDICNQLKHICLSNLLVSKVNSNIAITGVWPHLAAFHDIHCTVQPHVTSFSRTIFV